MTPIRIGKPKREAQSYLCNPHARWFSVVKDDFQMPKPTISGSSPFNMIKFNWNVENERQKNQIKSNQISKLAVILLQSSLDLETYTPRTPDITSEYRKENSTKL